MLDLPLKFIFFVRESKIQKIEILDSSFFSYSVEGETTLNSHIQSFFCAYSNNEPYSLAINRKFSPFSARVYKNLQEVDFGLTTTYKELAMKCGTRGYRAVGNCLNKNPFPLFIPCHRVLASNGNLGGFAFGKRVKEKILQYERLKLELLAPQRFAEPLLK